MRVGESVIETGEAYPRDARLILTPRLPQGERGTDQTIAAMLATIRHDARHPEAGLLALERRLVERRAHTTPDHASRSRHVYRLARESMRFRRDPRGVEYLRTPNAIAEDIARHGVTQGDCDESSALVAALAIMAGLRPVLVVCGRDLDGPYEHVFCAAVASGRLLAIDAQEGMWGDWPECAKARVYEVGR